MGIIINMDIQDQNTQKQIGKIRSVRSHIVEVEFPSNLEGPGVHDVLVLKEDPSIKFQVYGSSDSNGYYCIALSSTRNVHRGSEVVNTGEPLMIPVGPEVLGRVMNVFGEGIDGVGEDADAASADRTKTIKS